MMTFKPEEFHGIGQVWGFKILSKDILLLPQLLVN